MSTTSQHLGLTVNDGSDPFVLSDFTNNWNTIDRYPGIWICTSTTRPTWGSGQAGQMIMETDTRRNMLWTGTTWREMLTGPAVWWGSLRPGVAIGKNTTLTYVVGTFTVNRPGTLLGITTTEMGLPSNGYIEGNIRVMIDGSQANWDGAGYGEYFKADWSTSGTSNGLNDFGTTITSMGVRTVGAGTHSIGFRVDTASYSAINTTARITSCRALAMFVNGTDR
jgi:hypothetical protein